MARNVFRKYKALYPEEQVKKHTRSFNAIEAIYNQLNQNVKSADVTAVIRELQQIVSDSVKLKQPNLLDPSSEIAEDKEVYVDLSSLDFEKLKEAYSKSPRKNTITYNLQHAIEQKLEQMLKENPLRIEFYNRYQKIIKEYNEGKSLENTMKAFNQLTKFIKDLSIEEQRVIRENLNGQEVLAIYDLLKEGKKLDAKEIKQVKKVAIETLNKLKTEKLKIERWRESREVRAQVRVIIQNKLFHLPEEQYPDEDVTIKANNVYQHIYSNYYGGGRSVYQKSA